MTARPDVNGERLLQRLNAFAAIGGTAAGGVNRQALSADDREARALLARIGRQRGFTVYQDSMANLFLRRGGLDDSKPPFLIGSHLDSQPTGGRFDGALGTLAALETLETLEDAGVVTDIPVELACWTNEEGSRFAPGVMGSMAFSAGRIPEAWHRLHGTDGALLFHELDATIAALPDAIMRPLGMPVAGYLELHIEQGPSLEREGIPVGIVEAIQGTRWLDVTITGQAAHAGTTQLSFRRDPLAAATAALNALYSSIMPDDPQARFTVGRISVEPGSVNAIPGEVTFSVDLRHPDTLRLDALEAHIAANCEAAARTHHCTTGIRRTFDMAPAQFSPVLLDAIAVAAKGRSYASKRMLSGAFHDALFMARIAPSAMIFVPCRDGLSHNEAEFVEPRHSIIGAQMLLDSTLEAVRRLK